MREGRRRAEAASRGVERRHERPESERELKMRSEK